MIKYIKTNSNLCFVQMEPTEQGHSDMSKIPHFSSFVRSSVDIKTKHLTDFLINEIGLS